MTRPLGRTGLFYDALCLSHRSGGAQGDRLEGCMHAVFGRDFTQCSKLLDSAALFRFEIDGNDGSRTQFSPQLNRFLILTRVRRQEKHFDSVDLDPRLTQPLQNL